MTDALSSAAIHERASQMGGPPLFVSGDIFKLPLFEHTVVSERFPMVGGLVRMRYPNVGDEVEISRLTAVWGNTLEARIFAALSVCVTGAPASWYAEPRPNELAPRLAVERLLDFPALVEVYTAFILWRDSFRGGQPRPDPGGGAGPEGTPPLAGG